MSHDTDRDVAQIRLGIKGYEVDHEVSALNGKLFVELDKSGTILGFRLLDASSFLPGDLFDIHRFPPIHGGDEHRKYLQVEKDSGRKLRKESYPLAEAIDRIVDRLNISERELGETIHFSTGKMGDLKRGYSNSMRLLVTFLNRLSVGVDLTIEEQDMLAGATLQLLKNNRERGKPFSLKKSGRQPKGS